MYMVDGVAIPRIVEASGPQSVKIYATSSVEQRESMVAYLAAETLADEVETLAEILDDEIVEIGSEPEVEPEDTPGGEAQ